MAVERLVLFDIDGTLVRAGEIGGAVFDRAIEAVIGDLPTERVRMSGKTDPQIVREYLALMDTDDPEHLPAILALLESGLAAAADQITLDGSACPGAAQLLAALAKDERLHLSVLTGNIAPNAVVKLSAFGLEEWLDLETGAYGSDHEDRRALVPIALERLATLRGTHLAPSQTWVVGDTPRDYECAAAVGAHCLLVATGRFSVRDLSELGADAVVPDLSGTDAVVRLLTDGL
ncbi:MAG TPA: haloacid dehalogenase-like hydrolase [Acidimicrobiales bacterium]|nr:haloacid dehalogenase-like hydrolase [Acidimicrobiales bacterium]